MVPRRRPANRQGVSMLFEKQYILTETVEVEVRYRTETDTWTDEEGNNNRKCY